MNERILIVDDDEDLCSWASVQLRAQGYEVTSRLTTKSATTTLGKEHVDLILCDVHVEGKNDGIAFCDWAKAHYPSVPVIVMTAHGSVDTAVASLRAGAHDFVLKPLDPRALVHTIARALSVARLRGQVHRLPVGESTVHPSADVFGASPCMTAVSELVQRVAGAPSSIRIVGESGTGKELVARALHAQSKRAAQPFVAVNCAAVPEQLLESELFGHARGAFTDAHSNRPGLFVQASGGTLFLDEIGDMPIALQPKLLRALQDKTVRPVGADREVPFDARVVAATNANIEAAVQTKRFREDLYFRLSVITIEVPPLRERGDDVLALAQRFLERFTNESQKGVVGFSAGAVEQLLRYPWPGNVRELMNCIERAVALAKHDQILVSDLPSRIGNHQPTKSVTWTEDPTNMLPLRTVEMQYIHRVLDAVAGNKTLAARVLGIDRKTLHRKLFASPIENASSGHLARTPGSSVR